MKPNILVIFADQMRGDTLGCAGHPCVRTPHLDALAAAGVHFTHACTPDPICVPARASFTTGNYPHRCTGVKRNGGRIRDGQLTIASFLASQGYRTYASGKLHYVPYSPPGVPRLVHGFEQVALHESGRIIHQFDPAGRTPGLEDYHDYLRAVGWDGYGRAHGIGNNDIHPAPSPLPAEHYCDAWVCDRAMGFLDEHRRRHPAEPFFLFMSFPKPHAPYDPPRPYDTLYDPRSVPAPIQGTDADGARRTPAKLAERITHGWNLWSPECYQVARAHYYGQVTFQDLQIGRMVEALRRHGQLDNTIIVYTADHGDLLGDFGFFAKSCFYRGSVHIPFIMHWPAGMAARGRSDRLVGLQDLLPTLAALAGSPLPVEVDGMNLAPFLRGEAQPEREFIVSQCMDAPHQLYMVADKEWKYCYAEDRGQEELYDLLNDPDERTDVSQCPDAGPVLDTMRRRLRQWAEASGDHAILAGDGFARNPGEPGQGVTFQPGSMGWRWY